VFTYVRTTDPRLLWLNMLFLFTIVVLPFSAAVLADYPRTAPAIALYGTNVALCSVALSVAWWYAVAKRLSIEVQGVELRHVCSSKRPFRRYSHSSAWLFRHSSSH